MLLLALLIAPFLLPAKAEAQTRILIDCPSGPLCNQFASGHIDAVGTARLALGRHRGGSGKCLFLVLENSADGAIIRSVIAPNGTVYRAANSAVQVNPHRLLAGTLCSSIRRPQTASRYSGSSFPNTLSLSAAPLPAGESQTVGAPRMSTLSRVLLLALLNAPFGLLPLKAEAQTRIFIDCSSGTPCEEEVLGHIDAVGTARLPWVAALAVPANVCLQIFRDSSDVAIASSVIAPNGPVYRSMSNSTVQISFTPIAGWYTIQLDTPPPNREQIFSFLFRLAPLSSCGTTTPGR
jgi:hypothetical protein